MVQERILNIVVGAIRYKEKYLLIRRNRGDYQQKYALVGGKMDFDEEIQKAIQREIKEETGLAVTWKGIKAIINERLKDRKDKVTSKQFLIILCLTEADSNVVKESVEGELRWFSKEDIIKEKENIIPSDYLMITKLLEGDNIRSVIELDLLEEDNNLELGSYREY